MRRRDVIKTIAGLTLAAPWPAQAQQNDRIRRIGWLEAIRADTPGAQARLIAFTSRLQQLGWLSGRNIQIDERWGTGGEADTRNHTAELIALGPDVIVASGAAGVAAALKATGTIPIVFVIV